MIESLRSIIADCGESDVPEQADIDDTIETRNELVELFDFSTVRGKDSRSVVKSSIVTKSRVMLVAGTIAVVEEHFLSYSEIPYEQRKALPYTGHPLMMVKGCGQRNFDGQASMPCLRMDALDLNGYSEPIRDRDKDWRLDSQRDILDKGGFNNSLPPLPMGKYLGIKLKTNNPIEKKENIEVKRRKHFSQISMLISESHCLVDVLGEGIEGRVFVQGRNGGRSILIQIYSFWNCKKTSLTLTANQLIHLFTDIQQRNLMKPGMKLELIKAILERCYFTYKITVPPLIDDKKALPTVIIVDHLSSPVIPFGCPQSIEQIMREINLPPTNKEFFICPSLEQELKVGPEKRKNSRLLKLQERPERLRREENERLRLEEIYAQTPTRKKGLLYTIVRRLSHRMVLLSGYRFPSKRPGISSVQGFICGQADSLSLTVIFSELATLFKLRGLIQVIFINFMLWMVSSVRVCFFLHLSLCSCTGYERLCSSLLSFMEIAYPYLHLYDFDTIWRVHF